MKSYQECREIAENRLNDSKIIINRAYRLGEDYVFDNKDEEYIGKLPVVVRSFNGDCWSLWQYLNEFDMYMDDMIEIEFEDGRSRRDTDAIGIPIDITKVTPVVRPWTKEEADATREEYKRSLRLKRALSADDKEKGGSKLCQID